jgi:hypothetical protein
MILDDLRIIVLEVKSNCEKVGYVLNAQNLSSRSISEIDPVVRNTKAQRLCNYGVFIS